MTQDIKMFEKSNWVQDNKKYKTKSQSRLSAQPPLTPPPQGHQQTHKSLLIQEPEKLLSLPD